MIRGLHTAATGMAAQQLNIDVIANNLANVNTVGFKKNRAGFQDLLYQNLRLSGGSQSLSTTIPNGIEIGTGVRTTSVTKLFTQGNMRQTEAELDLAIEGVGLFQITLPDGSLAYTRAGDFKRDFQGNLTTPDGDLLNPPVNIPINTMKLVIGSDGTVSAQVAGNNTPSQVGAIQLARFENPSGLEAIGRNLFRPTFSSSEPLLGTPGTPGFGTIAQGSLETSNVNIAEELVNLIIAQRSYEINAKAIQTADEMLQTANNLKR